MYVAGAVNSDDYGRVKRVIHDGPEQLHSTPAKIHLRLICLLTFSLDNHLLRVGKNEFQHFTWNAASFHFLKRMF